MISYKPSLFGIWAAAYLHSLPGFFNQDVIFTCIFIHRKSYSDSFELQDHLSSISSHGNINILMMFSGISQSWQFWEYPKILCRYWHVSSQLAYVSDLKGVRVIALIVLLKHLFNLSVPIVITVLSIRQHIVLLKFLLQLFLPVCRVLLLRVWMFPLV